MSKNIVLLVDIQERLIPVMQDKNIVENSVKFLTIAKELGLEVIATQQYPQGLGENDACLSKFIDRSYDKMEFSAFNAIKDELKDVGEIYIIGVEAHICIYQTARDLLANGFSVTLIDECISARDHANKLLAYQNLKGAKIKPIEMVAFELLNSATHPSFKTISKLIK